VVDETGEDGMSSVPEVVKVAERLRESAQGQER
jgi:uncharacterized protein YoaH (UPF0181 family)